MLWAEEEIKEFISHLSEELNELLKEKNDIKETDNNHEYINELVTELLDVNLVKSSDFSALTQKVLKWILIFKKLK
nr:hypothetical protein [Mycoplasmopsis bovis]